MTIIYQSDSYRIVRGPMAGYTAQLTLCSFSTGEYRVELLLDAWNPRREPEFHCFRESFESYVKADEVYTKVLDAAVEMSQGSYCEPIGAW